MSETFNGYDMKQLQAIQHMLQNRMIRPEDLNNFWKAFELGYKTCEKQLFSIGKDVSEEIGRNIQLLLKIGKEEEK